MTISTENTSILVAGDGSKTSFTFSFVGESTSVIAVSTVDSSGVATLLSPTAYSITLNAPVTNQLWGVGGTVIYPLVGSPLAAGNYLKIQRLVPYQQNVSIQNQGNFYPQVTEQAMDILAMQIQQQVARTTQYRGIWLTGTAYYQGDIVQDGANGNDTNNYYICQTANTSGTWATDLANGDWEISALASVPTGNLTLTGDVTGSGTSPIATTLATVNSDVGSFTNASITVNGKGQITAASSGSTGSGTVTSVTYTGDGVLQSSTPSSAVTTSGTVAATLIAQAKNIVLAGPSSGSNANPTFRALVGNDMPTGAVVQTVRTQIGTPSTSNTALPLDNTTPQITEGAQILSLSITPLSSTNTLEITALAYLTIGGSGAVGMALFQDATTNALAAASGYLATDTYPTEVTLKYSMTAGTTSATTFKIRVGDTGGSTVGFNATSGGTGYFNGHYVSYLEIQEIKS